MSGTPISSRPGPARGFVSYAVAVSIAGIALMVELAATRTAFPFDEWQYWLFAGLILVGELMPVDVPRRNGHDRVTISGAFAFAMLLIFGLLPAVLAYAGASIIADAVGRLSPLKVIFNAAQYALAVAGAGAVMALLGLDMTGGVQIAEALPATLAGAVAFFVINHVLAGIAAAMLMNEPPARYLVTDLPFQILTAGFVLALAPVVVASREASIVLVPLCLLPTLAIYAGARQAIRDAHRAMHDALTDLPNRLLLAERLNRALSRAEATAGEVVLMIVDLDNFKAVNDTMGHAYGDRLLQEVTSRLTGALSEGDVLARLGGDEFAVLPAEMLGAEEGRRVAQRLVESLNESFELDGIVLDVRASVGVACFPEHATSADTLLRKADVALYCAKASQQPVEIYAPNQDHYTVDRLLLAGQLRRGLEANEIVLEYQPKFSLRGGRPTGVEALARWEHPELGRIGPDGFIPLAEQSGLVNRLTDVVMGVAIAQVAEWRTSGLDLRVAVNVSPNSLLDPALPRRIAELLDTHSVPAHNLQLEITESRSVPTGRAAKLVLEELRTMGVSLAIDDFGTGFSSLVQLQRLPLDEIKIDRSFVANMENSPSDAAIVRSTIDLARNLNLSVTAEGVESQRVCRQLAEMGCEMAQGYGLCRPVSADRCMEVVLACPTTMPAAPALRFVKGSA